MVYIRGDIVEVSPPKQSALSGGVSESSLPQLACYECGDSICGQAIMTFLLE